MSQPNYSRQQFHSTPSTPPLLTSNAVLILRRAERCAGVACSGVYKTPGSASWTGGLSGGPNSNLPTSLELFLLHEPSPLRERYQVLQATPHTLVLVACHHTKWMCEHGSTVIQVLHSAESANCTRYDMNGVSVLVSSPCPADKDVCWKTLARVQSRTVGMSETRELALLGDVQECPLQTPLIRRPLCVEYQATMESCSDKFHVDIPNVA
jgi:hypothetical protein